MKKPIDYFGLIDRSKLKKLFRRLKSKGKKKKSYLVYLNRLKLDVEASTGISTTDLVNKIFTFCELYSGITMYPYQEQFGKRIIRALLDNDGAEITALFSRQAGKQLI